MAKNDRFDTTIRIPVITDLVQPGDSDVIRRSRERNPRPHGSAFEHTLKTRIADIQAATGQDEYGKLGRAHAIRSESNNRQETEQTRSKTATLTTEEEELGFDDLPPELINEQAY